MSPEEAVKQPWIVWRDYGCEGFHPYGFATLLEAAQFAQPTDVVTKRADYDVVERDLNARIERLERTVANLGGMYAGLAEPLHNERKDTPGLDRGIPPGTEGG